MKSETIQKISNIDLSYPDILRTIKNAPRQLYYMGDIKLCDTPCLAVVGSRKATPYGKWAAYNIAKLAAQHGVTIVSGMASGIDTCGHMGALDAGGKTIAVLGSGADICYPRTNKELMNRIASQGLILTEYPSGTQPLAWQFPARNRIISGLSYAVLVVEADLDSGSIITAGSALEQGREVFALPGNINSIYSRGTNKLIQDGATPIIDIDDILEQLGIDGAKSVKGSKQVLGADEAEIIKIIEENGIVTMDLLCLLSGKPPSEIGAIVTILEIKGMLRMYMGKIHVAK